jgi:hypothetical protein
MGIRGADLPGGGADGADGAGVTECGVQSTVKLGVEIDGSLIHYLFVR